SPIKYGRGDWHQCYTCFYVSDFSQCIVMTKNINEIESNSLTDEFSPKKFIIQLRNLARYLFSKWWLIALGALLIATAACLYYYTKKPKYQAEITFTLDEQVTENPRPTTFAQLNEDLNILSPTSAGSIFSSINNIVELIHSRLL